MDRKESRTDTDERSRGEVSSEQGSGVRSQESGTAVPVGDALDESTVEEELSKVLRKRMKAGKIGGRERRRERITSREYPNLSRRSPEGEGGSSTVRVAVRVDRNGRKTGEKAERPLTPCKDNS